MPLLRKRSTIAIHFYSKGGMRILQKLRTKVRGKMKTVRSVLALDNEDITALGGALSKHVIVETKPKAVKPVKAKKVVKKAKAKKAVAKPRRARKAKTVEPKSVTVVVEHEALPEAVQPPTTPAPVYPYTPAVETVPEAAPYTAPPAEITNADVETETVAP